MQHDWIKSTLGHGETMCSRCFITNREAAVLGRTNTCDVPPPAPKATNDNLVTLPVIRVERQEDAHDHYEDDFDDDDYDPGEECGRWDQNAKGGMLPLGLCSLAGTEWCDWECPHSRTLPSNNQTGDQ
jgi:hypothetical protein